jgi:hypothetical protein
MSEAPADPKRASVAIFENAESERSRLEGFKVTGGTGTLSGFGATCIWDEKVEENGRFEVTLGPVEPGPNVE